MEILDLSTKKTRPTIKIDKVEYELVLPSDMNMKDTIWLTKMQKRLTQIQSVLEDDDGYDESAASEFTDIVIRMADVMLADVPEAARQKLTHVQKMAVVDYYAKVMKEDKKSFFDAGVGTPPNGKTSSQTSSASMEEA